MRKFLRILSTSPLPASPPPCEILFWDPRPNLWRAALGGAAGARPPAPRPRAPRRAPGLALRGLPLVLLTLALLFAQGNRVFHELLVRHTICEHGGLIHDGAHPPLAQAAQAAPDPALSQGSTPGHDPTDHDHCDAKSVLHRLGQVAPFVAPASLLQVAPPAFSGEHRASPPIALLDLAPKSSPPA